MSEPTGGWPSWVTPGWYILLRASDLKRGQVRAVTVAGKELAVYRTAGGAPAALDLYCAHLGASLALGRVKGDTIECAFHGWRYAPSGACVEIPRCPKLPTNGGGPLKIPANSSVGSYPVVERFDAIWIFVGDRRYYDLPAPEQLFGPEPWLCPRFEHFGVVGTSCRDVMENFLDVSHAPVLHSIGVADFRCTDVSVERRRIDLEVVFSYWRWRLPAHVTMYGTGFFAVRRSSGPFFWGESYWCAMLQPVGPKETRLYSATYSPGRAWNPIDRITGRLHSLGQNHALEQDRRIWDNKIIREAPPLCANDIGPLMPFRRWWSEIDRLGRAEALIALPTSARTPGASPPDRADPPAGSPESPSA